MPDLTLEQLRALKEQKIAQQAKQQELSLGQLRALRAQKLDEQNFATSPVPYAEPIQETLRAQVGAFGLRPKEMQRAAASVPTPDFSDVDPESQEGRREAARQRGVDFRRGAPFHKRMMMTLAPNIPTAQKQAAEQAWKAEIMESASNGTQFIKLDPDLGDLVFRRRITEQDVSAGYEPKENLGKWRWTAMDAPGLQSGDLAKLFDIPELTSILGSVMILGRGKPVSEMGLTRATGKQALGGFTGREFGNVLELALYKAQGGDIPPQELLGLLGSDAAVELFASLVGESASRYLVDPANRTVQSFVNKVGLREPSTQAKQAAEDAAEINAVIEEAGGQGKIAPSIGEATDDVETLVLERSHIKNASPEIQQQEAMRLQDERRGFREFIDAKFAGDPRGRRLSDITKEADTQIVEGSQIQIGRVTTDGVERIHIFPNAAGDIEGQGMTLIPRGGNVWQVDWVDLQGSGLKGLGLGADLYRAAVQATRDKGVTLQSDTQLTKDAVRMWEKLEAEGVNLKWNIDRHNPENWVPDPRTGRQVLETGPMQPIVEVIPDRGVTDQLLKSAESFQGEGGKFTNAWKDFLAHPNSTVAKQLGNEARHNRFRKSEVLEKMFEDYEKEVMPLGKFSFNKHSEWLDQNNWLLKEILEPNELARIRTPNYFRNLKNTLARDNENTKKVVSQVLKVDNSAFQFGKTENLVKALRNADSPKRRRAMAVLRTKNPELYNEVTNEIRNAMAHQLRTKLAGGSATTRADMNYAEWVRLNDDWLEDIFGTQYVKDLRLLERAYQVSARRHGIPGAREEATPGPLALFRAIFGPLSRKQRFITAARRVQLRRMGQQAINVVTDPAALRQTAEIWESPIGSRQATAVLARLGMPDAMGYEDIEGLIAEANQIMAESLEAEGQ